MSNLGFSLHFLLKLQSMISVFPPTQKRAGQIESSFFDGFITAALNRLDAHLWYFSKKMAFLAFFFKAVDCQQKRSMQKGNAVIQIEIQSCFSKIRQNGENRAKKMHENKTPTWTKVVSDIRKNGNSTSFAIGKRFQLQIFKESSE